MGLCALTGVLLKGNNGNPVGLRRVLCMSYRAGVVSYGAEGGSMELEVGGNTESSWV